VSSLLDDFRAAAFETRATVEREREGKTLADEAAELSGSLSAFVRAGWHVVWPNTRYVHGWHIDAICDKLEQVSAGEIRRLQVWVPPGTSKSTLVSIMWPVWEWTRDPSLRYITGSYDLDLASDFAVKSRDLLRSAWFQTRWPDVQLKRDQDLKRSYANTQGGTRMVSSPSGTATGRHGHRIIIDDPLNAKEVASEAKLLEAAEWHDGTLSTRFADPKTGAEVLIMQRLAEADLAGHVLGNADWTVLCLPERYEASHPFVWPDDPRAEGELLCPERVSEVENAERLRTLGEHRAAGQLQQRPAAREGAILKRSGWRFFPARWLEDGELAHLPAFTAIVQSWDTSFKDRTANDYVAGQIWGQVGADVYLLASRVERMSLSRTKDAMRAFHALVETRWGGLPHRILIEKSANGVEIIMELQRELRGVVAVTASVSKVARAEAAEPALESGNIYVPGVRDPDSPSGYDAAATPAFTQSLVEQCAVFPNGQHDDEVDAFTQAVNWMRGHGEVRSSLSRPGRGRLVAAGHLPMGRAGLSSGRSFGR
jgi:predicted phage terminase large subunit-like protein